MVERTIRNLAKDLAGKFYEFERSAKFRAAFPTYKDYLKGRWHQPDGSVKQHTPGWLHHVALARKVLVMMLGRSDAQVSPAMKERIFDAILEDRNNTITRKGASIHQLGMGPRDA